MKVKCFKFFIIILLFVFLFNFTIKIYASNSDVKDFWGDASSWFGKATFSNESNSEKMTSNINSITSVFTDMINVIGTTIIVMATIILGIKYIIGSVDTKTSAKEGLITLLIACVFFFGWNAIAALLFPNNNFVFTSYSDKTYENMVGRIFDIFAYIGNIVAVLLIIYVGVRYLFAGATGRSELKNRSGFFIIGIILTFATSNVLTFISKVINDALIVSR